MKRIAFIINPKSGWGNKDSLVRKIQKVSSDLDFKFEVFFTQKAGHATELANNLDGKYDSIFAVGGDGTINEIALGLLGSETPLGILPSGSGNGLARHLKIPMSNIKALKSLNDGNIVNIDTWLAGEIPFFMLCGLGFDAHIAQKVSGLKQRGPQVYIRLVINEFMKFKPLMISIEWEGGTYSGKPFIVNLANGSQFGNNMKIAPKASINDGYLDMGVIEKIPLHMIPEIILRMRNGTLNNFKYYKTFRAKRFLLRSEYEGINIDGEYRIVDNEFQVRQSPQNLKVLIPKGKENFI